MQNADITFVILTKDEAQNIAACLRSLPEGSPALVYDAMSSDDTRAQARALGATVVQAPWAGYVRARTAAAALVRTPWTFMLDADERLTPSLQDELALLDPPLDVVSYSVPRRNWFCGRPVHCAGWWPDRLVRLFRTGSARVEARSAQEEASVHETWRTEGRADDIKNPLEHFSYASLHQYRSKFARYTDLEAQGGSGSFLAQALAWLIVPPRFCWYMIARGGLLEGWRGAYVCAGSALYPAVVATKRRQRKEGAEAAPGR